MRKSVHRLMILVSLGILYGCAGVSYGKGAISDGTEAVSNSTIQNRNAAESGPGTGQLSSPIIVTQGSTPVRTVRVRLTEVLTNADLIDSPIPDSNVIIKSGDASFNKKTGKDGVVVFDAVPCGKIVTITARDEDSGEETV